MKSHIVQKGDTLYLIAKQHDIKLKELLDANPQIEDPNKIEIGMCINIPEEECIVKKEKLVEVEKLEVENITTKNETEKKPIMEKENQQNGIEVVGLDGQTKKKETATPIPKSRTEKKESDKNTNQEAVLQPWKLPCQARPFIYVMEKGDTLHQLAEKYHVSLKRLLELNPHINNPENIAIGTKIFVPGLGDTTNNPKEHHNHKHKKEKRYCPNCGWKLED